MKVKIKASENDARMCEFRLKNGKILKTPTYLPRLSWDRKLEIFDEFSKKNPSLVNNINGVVIPAPVAYHVLSQKTGGKNVIIIPDSVKSRVLFLDPCGKSFFYLQEKGSGIRSRKWLLKNNYISQKLFDLYDQLSNIRFGEGSSTDRELLCHEIAIELSNLYDRFLKLQISFKPDVLLSLDIPIVTGLKNIPVTEKDGSVRLITRIDLAFETINACLAIANTRYKDIDFMPLLSIHNDILRNETRTVHGTNTKTWDFIMEKIANLEGIDGIVLRFITDRQNIEKIYRFVGRVRGVVGDKPVIVLDMDESSYGLMFKGLDAFSCEMGVKFGKGRKKAGEKPENEGSWYHPQNKKLYLRREFLEFVEEHKLNKIPCSYPFCKKLSLKFVKNLGFGGYIRNTGWYEYTKQHYLESKNEELEYIKEGFQNPKKSFKVVLLSHILSNPHDERKDLLTLLKIIAG